jgi:carbonic anhydrase/acetyltransferase-like protein (isoleucine patch superfamily)
MQLFREQAGAMVASTAIVCGDVVCAEGVNIWFGAVVRGDVGRITLERNVNIQDGTIVHCDFEVPIVIEEGVVIGHAAVIHGVRIGRDTLIGIGARLLTGSIIGPECIVAAGAVVPPNMNVPARSMVMGIPAKVVLSVTDEELERTRNTNQRYRELVQKYIAGAI